MTRDDALLLVGGGGHCLAVLDTIEAAEFNVAGIVHGPDAAFTPVGGYPPLGRDEDLPELRNKYAAALITVGQIKSAALRKRIFFNLKKLNFCLPVVCSPYATLSRRAVIGEGTIVMARACINSGAEIGSNGIVNTGAIIEHECHIGAHCHISLGAILCGGVQVGDGTFIGAGAICREGIHIGNNAVIGCGARVLHDVPDGACIRDSIVSRKQYP